MKFSYYNTIRQKKRTSNIDLSEYINMVVHGGDQENFIYKARDYKAKGDEEAYKQIKSSSPAIMGSCLMRPNSEDKSFNSIEKLNGLILLDIDAKDQVAIINWDKVKQDPYVFILHDSYGGDGKVIFIKSSVKKPEQFQYYYNSLINYFFKEYGIISDRACKNPNRLRFISRDEFLYQNKDAIQWTSKEQPKKESVKKGYYFTDNSIIDHCINQVQSRGINLDEDDYEKYLRIGFALADEYGENGREYYHAISQNSTKYDFDKCDKQYTFCVKSGGQGVTIGTLFHYFKEAGVEIYTEKTKSFINTVSNAKRNKSKLDEGLYKTAETIAEIKLTDDDKRVIEKLYNDPVDYSNSANEELSETEILEKFICENYNLRLNELTKNIEFESGRRLNDRDYNTIYLSCKKAFTFTVNKTDVDAIIKSDATKRYNPIAEFFAKCPNQELRGYIDKFIECVDTDNKEFAKKYFKKWLVSGVHNWLRPEYNNQVSPLTLVLCGSQHGTGKTSFFRQILPDELKGYYIESKLKGDNDSLLLMSSSMILLDDEFGGKAFKENKAFKELSDKNIITVRRPYERVADDFKRITLLAGTTNEIEVLKDPTGNRRIIPINVKSINLDGLKEINTDFMLWEAYQLLKIGFEWVVRTQEDMEEILENCGQNIDENAETEIIQEYFSTTHKTNWQEKVVNQAEMLRILAEKAPFIKWNKHSLNDWALRNKLVYNTHRCPYLQKARKGYKIFVAPLDLITEITANQRPTDVEDMPF